MATRRISPSPARDAATVKMATDCERHVRILQEQLSRAREMTKLANEMVAHAASMRGAAHRFVR